MRDETLVRSRDFELRAPRGAAEQARWRTIRRSGLVGMHGAADPRRPGGAGSFPLALFHAGELVATVRVDLLDGEAAALRLVAVAPERRGLGFGRALLALAEDFVRARGCSRVRLHAARDALPFYRRSEYAPMAWDEPPARADSVSLGKVL